MTWFGPQTLDWILLGILAEAIALAGVLRAVGQHRWIVPVVLFLASGAFMVFAIRAALADFDRVWVAAALTAALPCHLGCLWQAWRAIDARPGVSPNDRRL